MNLLYAYADLKTEWNSSEWRCSIPTRAFNRTLEHEAKMIELAKWALADQEAVEMSAGADVIVVQRLFLGNALVPIEYWKARGKVIIGDVDDAYSVMPKSVNTYSYWILGKMKRPGMKQEITLKYPPYEQLKWGSKILHAVSSPSKVVLQDWSGYTNNLLHIPNYIEASRYLSETRSIPDKDKIVIGWGGSSTHLDSFKYSGIVQALCQLVLNDDRVYLHLAGGIRQVVKLFEGKVPTDRIMIKKWGPAMEWPATLASFDIGVIPLHSKYDGRRSPIKALEYTLMGIPWVGTKSPVHDIFGSYGVQVTNSRSNWYNALKSMVQDLGDYRTEISKAFDVAMSWDIDQNLHNIVDAYRSVGQNFTLVDRSSGLEPKSP